MPKKNLVKYIKPIFDDGSVDVRLQFNVKKSVDDSKKVKPKDVFEGYKSKKTKNK